MKKNKYIKTFLSITLLVMNAFLFITNKVAEAEQKTLAHEPVYGEFSLPDSAKWIFVDPVHGLSTNSGKTPELAVPTIATALAKVQFNEAILLLDDILLTSTQTINKNVIIASSPITRDNEPNLQTFRVTRDASLTANMFTVPFNIELHLANVIINGNRPMTEEGAVTGATIWVGTNHATYQGSLFLHDGAVLEGGNRELGGGAVILQHGLLYMNGGKITRNYDHSNRTIIGSLEASTNNKMYLISGEMSENITPTYSIGIEHSAFSEVYVGADFIMKNNGPHAMANNMPFSRLGINIINNFTTRKVFTVTGVVDEEIEGLVIVDTLFNKINPQPEIVSFIEPNNDSTLHAVFNSDLNAYFWKKIGVFDVNYAVITKPTALSEGLLARRAYLEDDENGVPVYDETNYIDSVILPVLNTIDYDSYFYDAASDEIRYYYIYNSVSFLLTYAAPLDGYEWHARIVPTATEGGSLHLEHESFPGVIFGTIALKKLTGDDYILGAALNDVTFTFVDPLGKSHIFTAARPLFGYVGEVKVKPTKSVTGSADILHPDYPGIVFSTIVLPVLNDYNYDLITTNETVTYRYFHNITGVLINIVFTIPDSGFYVDNIMIKPSSISIGSAIIKHPDLPDYQRTVTLPVLDASSYSVNIIPNVDITTGIVSYTYIDPSTNAEIIVNELYDYLTLDWNYGVDPTLTTTGTIIGTSATLPGATFTIELPKLSTEFYDITEGEDDIIYTLKDKTYGDFVFIVLKPPLNSEEPPTSEPPVSEPPTSEPPTTTTPESDNGALLYILGAVAVLLIGVTSGALILRKRTSKTKDKTQSRKQK